MENSLRKLILTTLIILLAGSGLYLYLRSIPRSIHKSQKDKVEIETEQGREKDNKGRAEYYFRMLRDPATNSIPRNVREKELAYANHLEQLERFHSRYSSPTTASVTNVYNWSQAGPYNIGGRTRALAIDINNSNHIVAGGVSGGIWESYDNGQTWSLRNTPDQNLSVSYVAQNPVNPQVWYYCSGEYVGNSASGAEGFAPYRGTGIFKSTDNGDSWSVLPSTSAKADTAYYSPFQYASRIAVSPTTGTLFVACYNFGILRSTDGGQTFSYTLGKVNDHTFIGLAVNKNGDILASMSSYGFNNPPKTKPGIYLSTDDGQTWKNVTPSGFPTNYQRTVMAFAPSKPSVAYTLTYDGSTSNKQSKVTFYKLTFKGDSLYSADNRSSNIPDYGGSVGQFNVQNNYNMAVSVKPDNPDFVILGATNLYRSNNGFASKPNKDYGWIGGYDPANNISKYPNQHPDQHITVFDPKNPKHVWTGHDGGVSYTSDITTTSTIGDPVTWTDKNNGYIVSQFYTIAMNKNAGDNRLLGGAQDNGSPFFMASTNTSTSSTDVSSGDGGFAYLGKNYAYTEVQDGDVSRHAYDAYGKLTRYTTITDVTPPNAGNQLRITPYVIDPNAENIMYYLAGDSLWRNNNVDGINPTNSWNYFSKLTPPSQYLLTSLNISHNPTHILYVGASSINVQNNKVIGMPIIYRINHSDSASTVLNRGSSNFPDGGYISDIALNPTDANKIMVVFSNYNIPSIYYSSDGGQTYTNVEGNLSGGNTGTGPSVRSATILPTKNDIYYIVGTSTGVYMTDSLNGTNTQWMKQANSQVGDAVVDQIRSRTSDGRVAAGTHGRGVFIGKLNNSGSALPTKNPVPLPKNFKLAQNYPNPFNPSTSISYSLPVTSKITLSIYNIMGQKVEQLISGATKNSGVHIVTFNASDLASGTYFYRITAVPQTGNSGTFTETKKMVLMK
ncbi:MAG TPA: T9SS type A sorting domain-containing protein [Balneolales bacterium]|nr:T9SS type A sorting domain-containing protein [Balneolales bacterium]